VRGPARDRVADLDSLPSPVLDGWFDGLGGDLFFSAVLETNRGCPYGCTFCDWGSATRSRIRSFGLDRVKAEIDWVADHDFEHLLLADANFGILERDREIAQHLVEARRRTGAPHVLGTNYAKNPKRHVVDIVADLAAGGFITMGQVALQTTDTDTLAAVNRANIRPENYDDLLRAFDELGLPIQTDLMMGLPGATPQAFRADLQHVVDSDVHAIVARTKVLRNSPMNDPDYKARFHLRTVGDEFVAATSSFDEADMDAMVLDHARFFAADDLGLLRIVLRLVRHRTGLGELDALDRITELTDAAPERFPTLWWVLRTMARWAVEPVDWTRLFDEVRAAVVEACGVDDDGALLAVLAVQHALVPSYGRAWPVVVDLDHDVGGWWAALKEVRRSGGDWSTVPDLAAWGPGSIRVDDPADVSSLAISARSPMA
ncbi:MAG: radical SAM protein, partial [Actinomycetota bacterium]